MAKHSGKIAVVTGGTGGLGKSVVERLLQEQATVIATHTDNKLSRDYISELKNKFPAVFGEVVDGTAEQEVRSFVGRITASHQRIDILCNLVGGVAKKALIEDTSLDEWNKMIALNLTSCFLMTRSVVPFMKRNGWGRIVNIAAMPALAPEAKRGGYGAAKSGVVTLTKTAAEEVKEFKNITVNAIAPSIILTEENRAWGSEEQFAKWVTPQQIAEMINHLCTDDGGAVNGQIIQMYGKVS